MSFRIGQGFDVHPWSDDPDDVLVLGGVKFPDEPGVVGHSDGDVLAHACTDAILGAAGLGDIGALFPDTDPGLAGADSVSLLHQAAKKVSEAGWEVLNIDCTIVVDRPRIAPSRELMQANLAEAVGASVSVKGKRTEGIASLGQGPQCWASALLVALPDADDHQSQELKS